MPWMTAPMTPKELKVAKRATMLYQEWDATVESVRRKLESMGYSDEVINRVFRHLRWE